MKKRMISLLLVFTFIFSAIPSFAAENIQSEENTGKVTINYLDMSGYPLKYKVGPETKEVKPVTIEGKIGSNYATESIYNSYGEDDPTIILNRLQWIDGETVGKFTKEDKVVNYYYWTAFQTGQITARYYSMINGKKYEIDMATVYTGDEGSDYKITPKDIPYFTPVSNEVITGKYDEANVKKEQEIFYTFDLEPKAGESVVLILMQAPTESDDVFPSPGTRQSLVVEGVAGEPGLLKFPVSIYNATIDTFNDFVAGENGKWKNEPEKARGLSGELSGIFQEGIEVVTINGRISNSRTGSVSKFKDDQGNIIREDYDEGDQTNNHNYNLIYNCRPILNMDKNYDYKDKNGKIYKFNSVDPEGLNPYGIDICDLDTEKIADRKMVVFLYDRVFTLTYDGNGNKIGTTAPVDEKSPYGRDGEATVMDEGTLEKEDFEFKGWNTKADGTGTAYSPNDEIKFDKTLIEQIDASDNKEGITLYAIWGAPTPIEKGSVVVNKIDSETKEGLEGATFKLDKETEPSEEKDEVVLDDKSKEIAEIKAELGEKTTELNTLTTPLEESGEESATESTNEEPKSLEKSSEGNIGQEPSEENTTGQEPSEENTTGQEPSEENTTGQEPDTEQQIEKLKEEIKGLEVKLELLNSKVENDSTENNPIENDPVEEFPKELTTDADGKATIKDLEDGTYTLKEIVAPEGYILEENKEYTIKVVNGTVTINDEADVNEITITNKKIVPTNEYRVTYDGNTSDSGTVPVDTNNPYAKDSEVTVLSKGNLTKRNYSFKGWNTSADGSGTLYKAGDTFKITANTTLYAQWQKDSEDSGTGWTWSGGSSTTSKESPKTEEILTHIAYLNGYPDNTIRPQGSITRAEVATIFARLKVGEANIPSAKANYNDVNSSDWYTKYIAFVTDNKIMEGYEDGSFKPNDKITRAEFTAVVARYNSLTDTTSTFEDVSGHWAAGYIGSVTNKGWINGYPDGTFKPEKDISREEAATMVNKMLDRKVDKDGLNNLSIKNFKDLDNSSWSYFDIVEASNSHKSVRRTLGDIMENWKELIK